LLLNAASRRPVSRLRGLVLVALLPLACASGALAQDLLDRGENVTVQDRPRPEYDPLGLKLGVGFVIFPKVTVGETFDDNIFGLPSSDLLDVLVREMPDPQRFSQFTGKMRPLTDAQLSIEPNITIKSNWNQHSLELTADAILDRSATYPDFSANSPAFSHTDFFNSDQYSFSAAGTLNVHHDLAINIDASYGRQLLPRTFAGYVLVSSIPTALDVAASFAPLFVNKTEAKIGVVKEFSRLRITLSGQFQDFDYLNGFGPTFKFSGIEPLQISPVKSALTVGPVEEGFQTHDNFTEFVRADYPLSSDFALFAEETVVESQFPNVGFRNRFDEETLFGSNFQVAGFVTAEVGVGYLYSHVSYPDVKPVEAPDFRAKITYFPTGLVDLTLSARQSVVDSDVPQSPDYVEKSFGLQGNYELLRNVIITGQASLDFQDYRVIDRHAQIVGGGVSATYLPNRGMRVTLAFDRRQFTSSGADPVARQFNEFNEDRVSLALTLQH
jgi:hypothetical protein